MKFAIVAAALATLAAGATQAAERQGPWAEGRAGLYHFSSDVAFLFGVGGGYDFTIGKKSFVGAQVGLSGTTSGFGQDFEVLARGGGEVANNTIAYGMAGFADGGFRIGAGAERSFGEKKFGKVEYRYTIYDGGAGVGQLTASFGIRF